MSEGLGDFLTTIIGANKNYFDYGVTSSAVNADSGIRNYIYSSKTTVNPLVYKTLDRPGYRGTHAISEVWAEMICCQPEAREDRTTPEYNLYMTREVGNPLSPKNGDSLSIHMTRSSSLAGLPSSKIATQ
ncbi:hypothetical protein BKA70DRAFT_1431288 [Coprinopsis sp. MPI-PUGE-AT-0042]|nr:hypothetical protein BKA70DRAFT_1431288 [Coprinopsis sp. MPI-PUGE-AT-0042]